MQVSLSLKAGEIARVWGPARLHVDSGILLLQGALFQKNSIITIDRYRSISFKALEETVLRADLGPGASLEKPRPEDDIIEDWFRIAEHLVYKGCKLVMVLGSTDVGKSSFTAFLANRWLLRGIRVGIIDADIGQADIGPPTTVSASITVNPVVWLKELNPIFLRFVGSITPYRLGERITTSIVDLYWRLKSHGVEVVIVNTDGWFEDLSSVAYKLESLRIMGGDSIVILTSGSSSERSLIDIIVNNYRAIPCGVHLLRAPPLRRIRRREDRKSIRAESYRKYFKNSSIIPFKFSEVSFHNFYITSPSIVSGQLKSVLKQIDESKLQAIVLYNDNLYLVLRDIDDNVRRYSERPATDMKIVHNNFFNGLLVSLVDEYGEEKALGIVTDIDFDRKLVKIMSPYVGPVNLIVFGSTKVDINNEYRDEVVK